MKSTSQQKELASLAEALRRGDLNDAQYEQQVDRLLGMSLQPRDGALERRWEQSRRSRD